MASQGTLNKVMLIGHTGDDVKIHHFDDGGCIGRFPLATNESYVNRSSGERVVNTEWHNIVIRNKAAEICEKYLNKGDKIFIEGRIKTRKWQDDKGMDRYMTEIQCMEFTFLTPKSQSGQMPRESGGSYSTKPNPTQNKSKASAPSQDFDQEEEDDDLPF